jgi:putative redox protein
MQINIDRVSGRFHFRAHNEQGKTLDMDASPAIGGTDQGFRPMETVLAALGGCSAIDIVELLRKQRQELTDIRIRIDGERAKDQIPAVFTDIHIHYDLIGSGLEDDKVKRAVDISVQKLCSVAKMLEKTAAITYDYALLEA